MTELQRRKAGFGLEQLTEGLQVLKAQLVGDLAHGKVGGGKLFLGQPDQLVVQVLLGILAGKRFEQPAQVTW